MIRTLLAGITSFLVWMAMVSFTLNALKSAPPIVGGLFCVTELFLVIITVSYVFNKASYRPGKSVDELRKEFKEKGFLENKQYNAIGYFEVNEFDDEGLHYFIDIGDSKTLYLNGQYLYDYIEIDDREFHQNRTFPCSKFEVAFNKDGGYVFEIIAQGNLIPKIKHNIDFPKWYGKKNSLLFDDNQTINMSIDKLYAYLNGKSAQQVDSAEAATNG